ncbi:hypothetical protein ABH992_002599 [Bradyrhizobium yuanmingense]|uniref:Uncharacterized protein n=1 Tax=Bradyrhizobium yuanmingense TaxID=108015 RepID=A0ABV4GE54_9BRAD
MISRARFSFSPRLRFLPGARIRTERLLVVEEEQHRGMLLDRPQHVGEAPEHVRPDRLALERPGPDPRQLALAGGDAEMIGPERDQALGEAAFGERGALQPRQRLGAKGFLNDVERLRRWLGGGLRGHVRLHGLGPNGVLGGLCIGHLAGDLCRCIQREIAAQGRVLIGRR